MTAIHLHQYQFRVVKRCLLVAEDLLIEGNPQVRQAVRTIYLGQLARILEQEDTPAAFIHYLLPRTLRTEYHRQRSSRLS